MHPGRLSPFKSLRGRVFLLVALLAYKLSSGEPIRLCWQGFSRRDLGGCFGDNPVPAPAGDFVSANFDQASAFYGEEVPGRKNFDIDDREDAMIVLMLVYFTGDNFVSYMMDVPIDGLVYYSCRNSLWREYLI